METRAETQQGVVVHAPTEQAHEQVITPEALQFLKELHQEFELQRQTLLNQRKRRQEEIDRDGKLDFLPNTQHIRAGNWTTSPVPPILHDRRVEITGPVDRKMIINALNSGAKVFMADFEDSTSPTWKNLMEGQLNLYDAVRGTISYKAGEKTYTLSPNPAVIMVRPRGWHMVESHILVNGQPMSASLVDFGLFVFHNGTYLAAQKKGPFFYLPKLESHLEAALWDSVFHVTEKRLGIERGTIKATVLIETILGAFEMEEIIYQLREHIAGLNAGRWDYIFSVIKKLRNSDSFLTPDRSDITMTVPFMASYAQLLVKTCHKRGVHAIGGMSAFIPSKDEAVNATAFEKVRKDKEREASQGYDGTWVAHPKLVSIAQAEFDKALGDKPNQKHNMRQDVQVTASDLLNFASAGTVVTEAGIRLNINVALLYLESWLKGQGAVALYNLMEDAATAEISRAQLWQWLNKKQLRLSDGTTFSKALYTRWEEEEYKKLIDQANAEGRPLQALSKAREILANLVLNKNFEDFITTTAYSYID